jgi:hypothetical protein
VPEPVLRVKVQCTDLPGRRVVEVHDGTPLIREPVYLVIQRGEDVVDQVPADRRQASFVAEFRVGEQKDGSPNFLGPFAKGSQSDRFFYLSWGIKAPTGEFAMFRRLKIRLGHLKWREIRSAMAHDEPLTVRLRLTDAKGCPLCATPPKTHIEWHVA